MMAADDMISMKPENIGDGLKFSGRSMLTRLPGACMFFAKAGVSVPTNAARNNSISCRSRRAGRRAFIAKKFLCGLYDGAIITGLVTFLAISDVWISARTDLINDKALLGLRCDCGS